MQSALLEAMQEKQVTIGDQSYRLEQPFLVMATQNPIEQEGTYPLPEAQVDRFMLKLKLTYPNKDEELLILNRMVAVEPDLTIDAGAGRDRHLRHAQGHRHDLRRREDSSATSSISWTPRASRASYGLDIAPYVQYGASPRATIFLARAAKAQAFLDSRGYVTPQDVKSIGYDVLRHRVTVTYEAEAEEITSEQLLQRIFDHLKVP